jgi:hypothetical protein
MTKIVKRESQAVEKLPDWVTSHSTGFETVNSDDLVMPRISICQAMSPQRQKSNDRYIKGLEEGDLFNTSTGEVYDRPLRITPVLKQDARIKWEDNKKIGSGIACFGRPAPDVPGGVACQLNGGGPCKYPTVGEDDSCTKFYNFPVILHAEPSQPVVISFKGTGLRVARNWMTQMMMFRIGGSRVPMYLQQFDLDTVSQSNAKGTFFNYALSRVPGLAPKDVGVLGMNACEELSRRTIVTDVEEASDEEDM